MALLNRYDPPAYLPDFQSVPRLRQQKPGSIRSSAGTKVKRRFFYQLGPS